MSSAVAVTAFRRGEHWAWWALLVGNTVALVSAMTYDKTVNAIGPFEVTEYLGLVMVWAALGVTAPFRAAGADGSHMVGAYHLVASNREGSSCPQRLDGA